MDRTRREGVGRLRTALSPDDPARTTMERPTSSLDGAAGEGPRLTVGSELLDGRLTIRGVVGEGGMGIVYEAFDASAEVRRAEDLGARSRQSRFTGSRTSSARSPTSCIRTWCACTSCSSTTATGSSRWS